MVHYQEDGHIILTVEDNGLGIRKDQQDKIFVLFKRLHNHVEGTGVGLYIVKKLLNNSGNQISVDSEPNEGSKFRVFFKQENLET